jgi:hypothetical protein
VAGLEADAPAGGRVSVRFEYAGPLPEIAEREILGTAVAPHHAAALARTRTTRDARWTVHLGPELLFDGAGLDLVSAAVRTYGGAAGRLDLRLRVSDAVFRDYYSLSAEASTFALPLTATRDGGDGSRDTVTIELPASHEVVPLPAGLAAPIEVGVPAALLLPYTGPFDLLFANQIALASRIRRRVSRSPWTWLRSLVHRSGVRDRRQRAARAYRAIHPTAEVHPTAVVEGAIIGPRARIGAHCVVRYSVVAEDARLHDGAKAELSVVGAGAWLMHDLVLYRSVAERGAFLIHGPYQFSYFQRGSGGFATIMMDYRPDGRPIQVKTSSGLRPYGGPFLGSVIGEGAKTLGGSLVAPGRIVPPNTWLAADPQSVHSVDDDTPALRPVAPRGPRRS